MVKKVAKRLAYFSGAVILLIIIAAAYSQTQLFRDNLRSFAQAKLDSLLNARVYIGTIGGNLITNLSIDSLSVQVGNEPVLLTLGRFEAHYDLLMLSGGVIHLKTVSLVNPDVRMIAGADAIWNFENMFHPTPEDTAKKQSAWGVLLDKLEIVNGSVRILDSAALARPDHGARDPFSIEYHDLDIHDVNLEVSGSVQGSLKKAAVANLSFITERPSFQLRTLSGEFSVGEHDASVKNLSVRTGSSSLEIEAEMKGFNLFEVVLDSLEQSPVKVAVKNSDVDLTELKRFLPPLHFLGGVVSTDVELSGMFGDLHVNKLHLATGQTSLHARGWIYNLHKPGELFLDLQFPKSTLHGSDVLAVVPGLHLPEYESLGLSEFALDFKGRPLDFHTKLDVENLAGSVQADVNLAIGGPATLVYDGVVGFQNLDLAAVVENEHLGSRLNGSARVEGRGVDFKNLEGLLHLTADSSLFYGNTLTATQCDLRFQGESIEGTARLGLGSMHAELAAGFTGMLADRPSFTVNGTVSSLNLQELLGDSAYDSDITMQLNTTGEGLSLNEISGDFQIDLISSRYHEYQIDSASVSLFIDQRDSLHKDLRLKSRIADFSLAGAYDLQSLSDLIAFEIQNLRSAVTGKFAVLDSSLARNLERERLAAAHEQLKGPVRPVNAQFELSIKTLEPLSILTGNRVFNGVGTLRGQLVGDVSNLSVRADLSTDELFYGNVESGFYMQGGTVSLEIDNLRPAPDPLREVRVQFLTNALDLHLNRNEFDSLSASLSYEGGHAQYSAKGKYGYDVTFVLDGEADVTHDRLVFIPGLFRLDAGGSRWTLDRGAALEFGKTGIRLNNIVMKRDSQAVGLNGSVGAGGELRASLSVQRLDLDDLSSFFQSRGTRSSQQSLAGVLSLEVDAGGTFDDPALRAVLDARNVSFKGLPFGEVRGEIRYDRGVASADVVVADDVLRSDVPPKLTINGMIPLRLHGAQEPGDERQEASLNITSNGIQINILEPLVPTFNDLTGILRCDLKVEGALDDLRYDGNFSLDDCRFTFEPNNIQYLFSGKFEPEGNRIRVVEAVARNVAKDERPGKRGLMRLSGDFALKDFVPTDFNLVATGELLVVKPESRRSSLPVYGDLYVETGRSGLRFTGTIEHSLLKGDVLVRSSRLVFPPSNPEAERRLDFSIPVLLIDDTSAARGAEQESFKERYFNPEDQPVLTGEVTPDLPKKSFLDGVEYDLNVETSGPSSEIKLVFSTLPAEELSANFQGKWFITGDGKSWVGDLTIDRASYSFYKQFDATGKLRYSGEFMDPELDIVAQYQSTRTVQDVTDSTTRSERVIVTLRITGSRLKPEHAISMTIDGIDYYSYAGPKSSDLESDAIAFIIAGTFPLSQSEANTIASDLQTTVGASLVVGASSLLTSELSEYLRRETGFIYSVELGYGSQGSFRESADIRLSGTAFKGFWRYRGTLLDNPFYNSNVSLLYSFGDILNRPSLRNFMFELERRTEPGASGLIDDREEVNSARLFYRISF